MTKKIVTDDGEIIDAPMSSGKPLFFKTPWNHDRDLESALSTSDPGEKTLTQQHLAKETELSEILRKFQQTGVDPSRPGAQYLDVSSGEDLQDVMVTSWEVEQEWSKLSPEIRNTLKDPQTYVNYVQHCLETGDLEPLRKMGLAKPIEEPTPTLTEKPGTTTSSTGGTPAPGGEKAAPAA